MRSRRRALLGMTVIAIAIGCMRLTEPDVPQNAIPYQPPASYQDWWGILEKCSGLSGDLAAVRWFVVPDSSYLISSGDTVAGYWLSLSNRIVMAGTLARDGKYVRHEMLHALVRQTGHPILYYRDRCGGLVSCVTACAAEADRPSTVPANAAAIRPRDLDIRVESVPVSPSAGKDGAMTLIVTATNARAEPVWVEIVKYDAGSCCGAFFGVNFNDQPAGASYTTDSRIGFAAGETKRYSYDAPTEGYLTRSYAVRGWFNAETTAVKMVTISR